MIIIILCLYLAICLIIGYKLAELHMCNPELYIVCVPTIIFTAYWTS